MYPYKVLNSGRVILLNLPSQPNLNLPSQPNLSDDNCVGSAVKWWIQVPNIAISLYLIYGCHSHNNFNRVTCKHNMLTLIKIVYFPHDNNIVSWQNIQ